jgi:hypothetical protein
MKSSIGCFGRHQRASREVNLSRPYVAQRTDGRGWGTSSLVSL